MMAADGLALLKKPASTVVVALSWYFFCYSSCNLRRWRRASVALRLTYNMSCHAGLLCWGRAVVVFQGAISFNLAAKWWRGTSVRWPSRLVSTEGESQSFTAFHAPGTHLADRFDSPAAAVTCTDSAPLTCLQVRVFSTPRLPKAQEGSDLKCSSSLIGDEGAEDATGVSLIG